MEIQPELLVKTEPSRIENRIRIDIFKRIFNEYKQKKIWLPFGKYDYKELARFGQSEEMLKFLVNEVDTGTDYTTVCNAIELLGYADKECYGNEIRDVLLKVILQSNDENFTKQENEQVQSQAQVTLARLDLTSREVVDQIVNLLVGSPSDQIRYGLYYLIHKSVYLDEYIEIFLNGIPQVEYDLSNDDEIHRSGLTEERANLLIGLEKAKAKESIKKILNYLIQNHNKLSHHSLLDKSLAKIAENAAPFAEDPTILELGINLVTLLANGYEKDEVNNFACFFDKSNTRIIAFSKLMTGKIGHYMNTLSMLANEECLSFFIDQYKDGKITDGDVRLFQNLLYLNNYELFQLFNRLINEKSGNKFIRQPTRDFERERKNRATLDIELLFNKAQFLNQIREIFEKEHKEKLTSDEVIKIMTDHWEDKSSSDLAINTLLQITRKQPVSVSNVIKMIENENWDSFCIRVIYQYYSNGQLEVLTKEQSDWIANWCYSNINKINFKKTLTRTDERPTSTSDTAIFLWFFLRRLNLSYPKDVLLDLLSFDWLEKNTSVGIEYLEELLDKESITRRVLENLAEGIEVNNVLENHFDYCARNKVKPAVPFALFEIVNNKRNNDARNAALNCLYSSDSLNEIENTVSKIQDEFMWTVIGSLIDHKSKKINKILKNMFAREINDDKKIKLAINLMEVEDLNGLKFYIEWVKKHKKVPETIVERLQSRSPIESFVSIEAIPDLFQLLEVSYDQAFQDDIPSLHNTVMKTLSAIGLQTDENYLIVKNELLTFIHRQSKEIKGVNFLHSYLDDLERSYYIQKSSKLSVDQIGDFLKKIFN